MPERRKSPRQAHSVDARIGYGGKYRLRCLILNISPEGAKLSLKSAAELPAEFVVSFSRQGAQKNYWARTTWRRGNVLGVTLTEPHADSIPLLGVRHSGGPYQT